MFHRVGLRIALLVVALASLLGVSLASAHESRTVGTYRFTVGFIGEPAFEGIKNGVDFRVAKVDGTASTPVTGFQATVQLEITYTGSNVSKTFPIRAVGSASPGAYTNDFIPTAPGQYRFRFFGSVEGVQLNESFTSGPDTFSNMQPAVDVQFPAPLPAVREVQGSVATAADEAASAKSKADMAMLVGAIGIVVGVVGLGVAGAAMMKKKA